MVIERVVAGHRYEDDEEIYGNPENYQYLEKSIAFEKLSCFFG